MAAAGWHLYPPPFSGMCLFGFVEHLANLEMRVVMVLLVCVDVIKTVGCNLFKNHINGMAREWLNNVGNFQEAVQN